MKPKKINEFKVTMKTGNVFWLNGKKMVQKRNLESSRKIYISHDKKYILKVGDTQQGRNEVKLSKKLLIRDRQYFVPILAHGELINRLNHKFFYVIMPYIPEIGDYIDEFYNCGGHWYKFTDKHRDKEDYLMTKYNLHDMHSWNRGIVNDELLIWDYGV
jgi:hypothetical protein